ncbi:MAG: DUF4974 domain-containing protein [Chitinophagaceae bacterium]
MDGNVLYQLIAKKMTEGLAENEQQALDGLLATSPELAEQYRILVQYWQTSAKDENIDAEWQRHKQKIYRKEGMTRNRHRWLAAAGVIVAIVVASAVFWVMSYKSETILATTNQERKRTVLPDGTLIVMNANSRLEYDSLGFVKGKRKVYFQGEGYFDVRHDTLHPFQVVLPVGVVNVLGTAFNINAYSGDNHSEIALLRGKITFSSDVEESKVPIILRPEEKIVIDKNKYLPNVQPVKVLPNNLVRVDDKDIAKDTAWLQNQMVMRNEPLGVIVKQLEHQYGVAIVVRDPELERYVYSGELGNHSVTQILEALSAILPFDYTTLPDGTIEIKKQ